MPSYICEVSDARGRLHTERREAGSVGALAAEYASGSSFLVSAELLPPGPDSQPRRRNKKRGRALAIDFTQMLSALLDSGLPLGDALEIASKAARQGSELQKLIIALRNSIAAGSSFSVALEKEGGCFSPFYRGMVALGERVGSVQTVMQRLSAYLLERKALRDKIAGASFYPLTVLVLALAGAAAIAFILIPRLSAFFESFGGSGAAQMRRSGLAMELVFGGIILVFALAGLALFWALAMRRKGGESAVKADAFALRLPLAGGFLSSLCSLEFCSAMETLAAGSVPLSEGIGAAAAVVPNAAYRAALDSCAAALSRGLPLSEALRSRPEIPGRLADWAAIGERSGQVEAVFGQLRRYYSGEVERILSRFMAWIEPLLILAVGILIIVLIFVFVLPLFSLYEAAF